MNGLTVSTSAFLPTIADTNWEIGGRGDFNGDGKADVILRNKSTGQDIGWLMNGLTVSTSAFMPTIADTNWEIKGVGDFDGDGKADVILRNKSTGQNIGWLMNGLTVATSAFLPTIADTNWEIVGVGDFNGDGKADVLLRNKITGQNIGWLMNGLTVSLGVPADDCRHELGDQGRRRLRRRRQGRRHPAQQVTGQNIGWLMNGLTVSTSAFLPTIADTNWEIKGTGRLRRRRQGRRHPAQQVHRPEHRLADERADGLHVGVHADDCRYQLGVRGSGAVDKRQRAEGKGLRLAGLTRRLR